MARSVGPLVNRQKHYHAGRREFGQGMGSQADKPTSHALFLDDSGTKEYAPEGEEYRAANTRYFVFAGPLLHVDEARRLTTELRRLKKETFGRTDVELKSNWLRIDRERVRRYLDRHKVTEDQLREFVEQVYSAILAADLELVACVVDKQHMREKYGELAWYPPAAAYEPIIQRAQNWLDDGLGGDVMVVVDDMTGATPKGNQYRLNLTNHHSQLKKSGSRLWPGMKFPGLRSLLFVDSRRSDLVQVADLVAYNVYRQFREYGEQWEQHLDSLPTYDWFRRIAAKFRRDSEGRIQGYGVVKIPLINKVKWTLEG